MASIKDFQVMNTEELTGHEGEEVLHADLYYKGEKIGRFEESMTGGPADLSYNHAVNEKEMNKKLEEAANYLVENHPEIVREELSLGKAFFLKSSTSFVLKLIEIDRLETHVMLSRKSNVAYVHGYQVGAAYFEDPKAIETEAGLQYFRSFLVHNSKKLKNAKPKDVGIYHKFDFGSKSDNLVKKHVRKVQIIEDADVVVTTKNDTETKKKIKALEGEKRCHQRKIYLK